MHQRHAIERLERADEARGRKALALGDGVHQVVHPVGEIDVGEAGRPVERRRARRESRGGVAGGIVLADVGLGLDDDAARESVGGVMLEHLADQVVCDLERRAGEE